MTGFEPKDAITQLWAKTGDGYNWLSLPQHMLDTAAVATKLVDAWLPTGTLDTIAGLTGLSSDDARSLAIFCAAAHDIGKASISFQTQADNKPGPNSAMFSARVRKAGLPLDPSLRYIANTSMRHWHMSAAILEELLRTEFGLDTVLSQQIANIAGAHHGRPTSQTELSRAHEALERHPAEWHTIHLTLLDLLLDETQTRDLFARGSLTRVPLAAQMLLCGLVIPSDWTASNENHFRLHPTGTLALSREDEDGRARDALATVNFLPALQWKPTPKDNAAYYSERFHWPAGRTPNPLQNAALDATHDMVAPGIMVIEAPMGTGKTEAALACAEHLASRFHKGGVYFATPTTATSDGLFPRVTTWAHGISALGATSLFLAHSRSGLNEEYRRIQQFEQRYRGDVGEGNAVVVEKWLSSSKGGILAQSAIGTVDQSLMIGLTTKHVMLRHLGFANKVVIIDEAHAYDSYMNVYLERALEWMGAYKTPVIILSATLPSTTRRKLIAAYNKGAGFAPIAPKGPPRWGQRKAAIVDDSPAAVPAPYPVITVTSQGETRTIPVERDENDVKIAVQSIDDDINTLTSTLDTLLDDGGCALVICNTVRRAQEAYRVLSTRYRGETVLLHSQFVATDRSKKETDLSIELGPPGRDHDTSQRPRRRVVVATQVVEQSLDVDFDVMVTDMCPIDLLLQRAGRLHRHRRPPSARPMAVRRPQIFVRGIESHGGEDQLPRFAPEFSSTIYSEALLIASYAALRIYLRGTPLAIPSDINPLVQQVYREPLVSAVPEEWSEMASEPLTRHYAELASSKSRAKAFLLCSPHGALTLTEAFGQSLDAVEADTDEAAAAAQVRDTDPTLEVLLAVKAADGGVHLLKWAAERYNKDPLMSYSTELPPTDDFPDVLARSMVRLPHQFSSTHTFAKALDELESNMYSAWQKTWLLKGQLIVVLNPDLTTSIAGIPIRYDRELGLLTGKNAMSEASPTVSDTLHRDDERTQ